MNELSNNINLYELKLIMESINMYRLMLSINKSTCNLEIINDLNDLNNKLIKVYEKNKIF